MFMSMSSALLNFLPLLFPCDFLLLLPVYEVNYHRWAHLPSVLLLIRPVQFHSLFVIIALMSSTFPCSLMHFLILLFV